MLSNFFLDDVEDEIFGHQMRQMRHMSQQMMRGDPFGGFGLFGGMRIPSIMDMGAGSHSLMPHMNMNMNINHGFPDMSRLLAQGSAPGVSYSSSSVFCMSSNGNGQPQIYKETSSMRAGPNGVRETRRTVEDSQSGKKMMALGHHIGEKARVIEKEQNIRTGEREEREELINLDEEEAEDFERDFQHKAQQAYPNRRHQLQIEEISSEPLPAIMSAEDYQRSRQGGSSSNNINGGPSARRSIRSSPLALPSTSHHHRSSQDASPSLLHHPYNSPSRKQTKSRKIKGHLHHQH